MKAKLSIKQNFSFLLLITVLIPAGCNSSNESGKQATTQIKNEVQKKDTTLNIDPVKLMPDKFKVLLENEHVRVVEYSLKPGEKDDWHTHPPKSSYVVAGGKLKVHLENGEIIVADEKTGTASWMNYVGKHYVENIGTTTVTIVFTEIK